MTDAWMVTGLQYLKQAAAENKWNSVVDQLEIAEALIRYRIELAQELDEQPRAMAPTSTAAH
jgi:hypothetical protein